MWQESVPGPDGNVPYRIALEKFMIDNFAIAFFTICVIYTAFRTIKLERASKESTVNTVKEMELRQQQSVANDTFPKNPG